MEHKKEDLQRMDLDDLALLAQRELEHLKIERQRTETVFSVLIERIIKHMRES